MNDTTDYDDRREALIEVMPDNPFIPDGEVADALLGGSTLPIDRSLEIVVREKPGDEFERSHPAAAAGGENIFCLTPEHAQKFDEQLGVLIADILIDEFSDDNEDDDS